MKPCEARIFGGMSVYNSYEVKALKKKNDLHGARLASARVAKWGLWALLVGVVIVGAGTIIGVTNGRVAPQPPEEDDGDSYAYGYGDDGDDGDDGDAEPAAPATVGRKSVSTEL